MPDSIFNDIVRYKARKLAQKHVKRALHDFQYGGQFDFKECLREINNNYWQRKSVNMIFDTAYAGPWYVLGGDDALKGRKRFDVPAYLDGWKNQVWSLTIDGWISPQIIKQFGFANDDIRQYAKRMKHELNQLEFDKE
ncbi:hypothetical protein [Pseudomonas tussilaginis]|uniref:hypothetical protein n=1 Tax=Pseudomonas putida TaxID=303 RepID=UPI0023632874|nr:hypothetical protein [Pseudomonas putida]MDD1975216.1 hypothetical protein [Pseudomonas putida]